MKSVFKSLVWLIIVVAPTLNAAETIDWKHWELDAFAAAKAENKVILVSVGMEGCAACARMESLTYTDSDVIDLINEKLQ